MDTLGSLHGLGFGVRGNQQSGAIVLPQNLVITPPAIIQDMQNVGLWHGGSLTLGANTSEFIYGNQSIKITTTSGANNTGYLILNSAAYNYPSGPGVARISYYLHDANVKQMVFLMGNANDVFRCSLTPVNRIGEWITCYLPGWTVWSGAPDWSKLINKMQLYIETNTGGNTSVSIGKIEMGGKNQPAVVFSLDDGLDSAYSMYQYLHGKQMVGTDYVISNSIGTAGHLTVAQMQEMDGWGWDIGNHTRDHTDLISGGLSDAQIIAEFSDCKSVLDGFGLTRASMHAAMPYGSWSAQVTIDAQAAGILSVRDDTGMGTKYPYLPFDQWIIWPRNGVTMSNTMSLIQAKAKVDAAIAGNYLVEVVGHGISTVADATHWVDTDFYQLVDYIVSLGCVSLTTSELYRLQSGPITIDRSANHH